MGWLCAQPMVLWCHTSLEGMLCAEQRPAGHRRARSTVMARRAARSEGNVSQALLIEQVCNAPNPVSRVGLDALARGEASRARATA